MIPQPPFNSAIEELLFGIYQKLESSGGGLKPTDLNTLAKLNALLIDADLMSSEETILAINGIRGNVPVAANSLEKLYNIILALNYLRREDIDTLAELNAILLDADIVKSEDLNNIIGSLPLNKRIFRFFFDPSSHDLDRFALRGKINSLTEDFTNELQGVTYKTRTDASGTWAYHSNIAMLQVWINANVNGSEISGTKYWIKCVPIYKSGHNDEAMNEFGYVVSA
ncbi:hypothetical protein KK083_21495 [Fulvivirgaceae bacterium PWU4]|uniref:Uncharacterized protein n=1 Tax=Chryseosolibacter histidini TaxID=2782349 RepID=A0AAP2GRE1_9BACT|nr:hypothetical protein [Chryseosolibacter histidini]MBT1699487.1 hypothetical protein [Chryseosolibacter histidini]